MAKKEKDVFVVKKDHVYMAVIVILAAALVLTYVSNSQQVQQPQIQQQLQPSQPQQPQLPVVDSVMDDDPKIGSDSAPVVIIEFSDFQCPFCRRFWTESFSQLKSEYIDTGKVQFVYRDFPLSFHPMAQKSAEAAECANEQGLFLEMHNKIFEKQNELGQGTVSYTLDDIKAWASEIEGLDVDAFNQCLDSGKYAQEVQKDFNDGVALGVQGTPTFYIGRRGEQGTLIVGAQPYSVFKQAIDSLLGE